MLPLESKSLATHDGVFFLFDEMRAYVRIDSETITPAGIDRLVQELDSISPTNLIHFQLSAMEWQMRENLSLNDTFSRLEELRSGRSGHFLEQRYRAQQRGVSGSALGAVFDSIGSRKVTRLKEVIDRHDGLIDTAALSAMSKTGLGDRVILMEAGSRNQIVFRHIGEEHARRFGSNWPKSAVGTATDEEQPDARYSDWVHAHYLDALENGARRDHIDAVIHVEEEGAIPIRSQYDRLLHPIRFPDGQTGLLAVSEVMPKLLPLTP